VLSIAHIGQCTVFCPYWELDVSPQSVLSAQGPMHRRVQTAVQVLVLSFALLVRAYVLYDHDRGIQYSGVGWVHYNNLNSDFFDDTL
jgi:hypothetical protein